MTTDNSTNKTDRQTPRPSNSEIHAAQIADGNGRMGRLWQSLILGKWNPVFQFLPVENMVHTSQQAQAYYDAINASSTQADCAPFIDYMLAGIHRTLGSRKGEPKGAGIGIKIGLNIE